MADRYSFLGGLEFQPTPLAGILSPEYVRKIALSIDLETARLEDERELQPWVAYTPTVPQYSGY